MNTTKTYTLVMSFPASLCKVSSLISILPGINLCYIYIYILKKGFVSKKFGVFPHLQLVSLSLTDLCVKFHFQAEIFGVQGNNVAVPIVQFSLGRKKNK